MDDLKTLLGEELYKQVSEKVGDKKLIFDDGNMIPKYRFDEVNTSFKESKESKENLEKELSKIKRDFKDTEGLTQKIESLQEDLKNQKLQSELKEKQTLKRIALKDALNTSGAKHPDLLESKFELDKIELDTYGKIIGFDEILKPVKEGYKDLFGEEKIVGYKPVEDVKSPIPGDPKFLSTEDKLAMGYKK